MSENLPVVMPLRREGGPGKRSGLAIPLDKGPVRFKNEAVCDLVFVIDTTGSMDDEIDGLLGTSQKFVDRLAEKRVDWQVAIVSFGDLTEPGDKIEATPFSKDVARIKGWLRIIPRNSGGGNEGESCLEALEKAMGLPGFRPNAIKVFILMTDEPAHQRNKTVNSTTARLKEEGIVTFVISIPLGYYQRMARDTGGMWFQISSRTNFLSILDRFSAKVAEVIEAIQLEAGGDVRKYLQLKSGHS